MVGRSATWLCWAGLAAAGLIACGVDGPAAVAADCTVAAQRLDSLALEARALGREKRLLVYLPPGYGCDQRRYPVVYFNDGQDLFDWYPLPAELTPAVALDLAWRERWYGSWRLDRQLDQAVQAGLLPPTIIVGIASDDGFRNNDLVPVAWAGAADPEGAAYGAFVAEQVIPVIDQRYLTRPDRRCRTIAGASLGGVSALQIGLAHPAIFGRVLAMSPVLRDPPIAGYLASAWTASGSDRPQAMLVDLDDDRIGTDGLIWLRALASAAMPFDRQLILRQPPGARHHIASWAERILPALRQLIADGCS